MDMWHIVNTSGGAGSWAATMRVIERYGRKNVVRLFADVKNEDEDLYRFLNDTTVQLDIPLTVIAEGRNPWEVFRDERYIGNSRVDPCSRILKRELLDRWHSEHYTPENCIIYIGIGWWESHRLGAIRERLKPWRVEAPMCDPPYMDQDQILEWMKAEGITPPRLYKMGFHHNNCGGACVKAGQAQWALLLRVMPERYRQNEEEEEKTRAVVGDYSVLRDRKDGKSKPLTLRQFRERIEQQGELGFDKHEWGGCGCAVE